MRKNLFIAFEGIDGSGKSTQVKLLSEALKKEGHKVYSTFEPTSSPIGAMIRNIFTGRLVMSHETIAGLFVADRLDHLQNEVDGILKKLEEGYTVICDRSCFSSYAYQGAHVPMDWVIAANSLSAKLLRPDVNIYIDMLPEVSMERIAKGRNSTELYETLDNLKAVKSKYEEAMELLKNEEKIARVNGNRSMEEVSVEIREIISNLMNP